jgi:aspartyl-tRNA(Asn)/glutamyl-tRNA(Gln) amidotransferase subunit B
VIEKEFADAYESAVGEFEAQKFANWMRGPLRRQLNYSNLLFRRSGLTAASISELYDLFSSGSITDKASDQILIKMLSDVKTKPSDIAKSSGLLKSADSAALKEACMKAVKENEKAVSDLKAGNQKSLFFLVGKVMQETKGTFDAKEIAETLKGIIG